MQLEQQLKDCPSLIQGIMVSWQILLPPCLEAIFIFGPCFPVIVLESTALLKSEVNGGGDSHSGAAIHTLSSSASKAWLAMLTINKP